MVWYILEMLTFIRTRQIGREMGRFHESGYNMGRFIHAFAYIHYRYPPSPSLSHFSLF